MTGQKKRKKSAKRNHREKRAGKKTANKKTREKSAGKKSARKKREKKAREMARGENQLIILCLI